MFTPKEDVPEAKLDQNIEKKLKKIAELLNTIFAQADSTSGWEVKGMGSEGNYLFIAINHPEGIIPAIPDPMPFNILPKDVQQITKKIFTPTDELLKSIDFTKFEFSYGTMYDKQGIQAYLFPKQNKELFDKLYQLAEANAELSLSTTNTR